MNTIKTSELKIALIPVSTKGCVINLVVYLTTMNKSYRIDNHIHIKSLNNWNDVDR